MSASLQALFGTALKDILCKNNDFERCGKIVSSTAGVFWELTASKKAVRPTTFVVSIYDPVCRFSVTIVVVNKQEMLALQLAKFFMLKGS